MITLVQFWAIVIVLALFVYILLDGFDLGVGALLGFADDEHQRSIWLKTIEPVWDGNETWLVVLGATLYAAFPIAYAIYMPALYLGIVLLLLALILRGVGLEFRHRSRRNRHWWDRAIIAGSITAGFVQGAAIGLIISGVTVENGQFTGTAFDWVSVFNILCGVATVAGYAVHGLAWLILKTDGVTREQAYRRMPWFYGAWVLMLVGLFAWMMLEQPEIYQRWSQRPGLWTLTAIGAAASLSLFVAIYRRIDGLVFAMTGTMFVVVVSKLVLGIRPYIVPWTVTVQDAASPPESLSFLLFGGVVVIPVILLYTGGVYWVFRGKISGG